MFEPLKFYCIYVTVLIVLISKVKMVKSSYSSIAGEERVLRATMLFNKESK